MTRKVFWEDPYLTHLETTITHVDGVVVQVAATIIYALAGGQESDAGTLGGYPVLAADKLGHAIRYTLPAEHGLRVGDPVMLTIDWTRRYRLMRLHFAAELILELAYRHLPTIEKIGAHIAADKARIDFRWPENIAQVFPHLHSAATALITANHPILSTFTDVAAERRCWAIAGFGQVACGGTHLRTTGEIGALTLKRKNIGQYKERIEIYLDAG